MFGLPLSQSIAFALGSIPETGGVETGQGEGTVSLSAIAHNPDGGDVTLTFYEGRADLADGGFQGLVDELPSSLEFDYEEAAELDGSGRAWPRFLSHARGTTGGRRLFGNRSSRYPHPNHSVGQHLARVDTIELIDPLPSLLLMLKWKGPFCL